LTKSALFFAPGIVPESTTYQIESVEVRSPEDVAVITIQEASNSMGEAWEVTPYLIAVIHHKVSKIRLKWHRVKS
jgi:hypothetical protein